MTPQSERAWVASSSWHPKVTPYRLAFILTTGGLGIAKAVLISGGRAASSTTIEWVAGVVVALSFQLSGPLEYAAQRPRYVDWIFSYDCLNIPRTIIRGRRLDIRDSSPIHTKAHQDQEASSDDIWKSPPIVTAYRLFVSAIISGFGLVKMICAYRGLPGAMNTLEWIVAVPMTLSLYYVGLYEDLRGTVPRKFFDIDYSGPAAYALGQSIVSSFFLSVASMCISWITYWSWILLLVWNYHKHSQATEINATQNHSVDQRADLARTLVVFLSLSMIHIGSLLLLVLLWPLIRWGLGGGLRALWGA
ncbi:hypothetical protein D9619_012835 [Psilocybe cf. subviscida]|uniref:Uncharacterized protein n=1 Tax=Psilocybe cf. subviscida TaxID=2480587 RepID=A0A8H5ER08_9AGAR|nr:hypothetical protein D9619_012835 [Psilocybe cf. subviscida]